MLSRAGGEVPEDERGHQQSRRVVFCAAATAAVCMYFSKHFLLGAIFPRTQNHMSLTDKCKKAEEGSVRFAPFAFHLLLPSSVSKVLIPVRVNPRQLIVVNASRVHQLQRWTFGGFTLVNQRRLLYSQPHL